MVSKSGSALGEDEAGFAVGTSDDCDRDRGSTQLRWRRVRQLEAREIDREPLP